MPSFRRTAVRSTRLLILSATLLASVAACSSNSDDGGGGRHHHGHRGGHRGEGMPLRMTAFGVNLGSTELHSGGAAATVEIQIDRWSRPEERQTLLAAFSDGGSDALLTALQHGPVVGSIRTPDHVGLDLHYAVEHDTPDGGRRIFLATDRRIGFWEEANQTRSSNYPFTLVEIRLDADGHGEGRLSIATKITASPDKDHIELENYSTEPVRLQDVRVVNR